MKAFPEEINEPFLPLYLTILITYLSPLPLQKDPQSFLKEKTISV